jgi:Fe-S-cluster containining protein
MRFRALAEPSGHLLEQKRSSGVRQRFDCQACGACCCNTQRNRDLGTLEYVEVTATDGLFTQSSDVLERLTVRNAEGRLHLRMIGDDQRCASLDGDVGEGVSCEIYALRPSGCREVEAGDDECIRARKMHGLPLTSDDAP